MAKSAKLLKRLLSTGKLGAAQEFALQRLEERLLMTANPVSVWTGNGGDNKWSTAANWDTNAVPEAGDDLEFAAGAAQLASLNDLDAGTHFNSISFTGAGYTVNGNEIFVHAGISNSSGGTDTYAGRLYLLDEGQSFAVSSGSTLVLSDVVTSFGVGTIAKTGTGTLVMQGSNDLDGDIAVSDGTLEIDGSQATGVTLSNGTLAGSGSVGGISATGGTVSTLLNSLPVTLVSTGDVSLGSGSTLRVDVQGASAYGQLDVMGNVTLGGTLSVNFGYNATIGDAYTLINNDGIDAVVGTFSGLAEGSTVAAAGQRFQITYHGGDGNDVMLTRVQDGSAVALVSGGGTVYGQNATFTATVTGQANGADAPAGSVQFYDGATALGNAVTLDSNGAATLTIGSLSRATHSITAVYSGTDAFATSTSNAVSQVVAKSTSGINVAQDSLNSVVGETINLTATVGATGLGSGGATGTVRFLDGVTTLGTVSMVNGTASLNIGSLPLGTRTITALYSGDTNFGSSSTPVGVSHTVNQDTTTITVSSSTSSPTYNDTITFTASVSADAPGAGTTTGTISFFDGANFLGAAAVSGGQATLSFSGFDAGSHAVTAVYSGDSNFTGSTTQTLTQNVNAMPTVATVDSLNSSYTYGDLVPLAATVSSGLGGVDHGTVSFYDGITLLGSAGVQNGTTASYSMSSLGAGSHSITAVYQGSTNFAASSPSEVANFTIEQAVPVVGVVSSNDSSGYSDSVTFTATVSSSSTTPTGAVQFYDGETLLGTGTLDINGQATLSTSFLDTGIHTITAAYQGDANFQAQYSTTSQSVAIASTSLILNASTGNTTYNDPVTYSVSVSSLAGTPIGDVYFYDGATLIGQGALDSSGEASLTLQSIGAGFHGISASFAGSQNFSSSSDEVFLNVAADTSTTSVVSSGNTPYGLSVTFTASVIAANNGPATGTVSFFAGATLIGTDTLDNDGQASISTALDLGNYSITAVYSGDSNVAGSNSDGNLLYNVSQATTTTNLSITGTAVFGEPLTLTAAVSTDGGMPEGLVSFFDGANLLGSVVVEDGMAALTTSTLGAGDHSSMVAVYSWTSHYAGSTSSNQYVSVEQASTDVSVQSTGSSTYGAPVTFTATISSEGGIPTGTASFFDGAILLGTSVLDGTGQATFTTSSLSVSLHSIAVVYTGDSNFTGATSSTISQQVEEASTNVGYFIDGPVAYGDPLIVHAEIASLGGTPSGTVQLFEGETLLDTATLDQNGLADLNGSGRGAGFHVLSVVYQGDGSFAANNADFPVLVDQAATSTDTAVNQSLLTFGQSSQFTATVSSTAGTPTGSVQFYLNGDAFGDAVSLDQNGMATMQTTLEHAGSYTISAIYLGDDNFAGSTDPVAASQEIVAAGTTVTTPSVPEVSTLGDTVTLSATVQSDAGIPEGTLEFFDGATYLGGVSLDANGTGTLQTSDLNLASNAITAVYTGSNNYSGSTSPVAFTYVQSPTTTMLVTSVNPAVHGQSMTTFISVMGTANGAATPSGVVSLYDGEELLATVNLDSLGNASWTCTLATGEHSLFAVYAGDEASVGSETSSAYTQSVDQAATSTVVSVSNNPSVHGQSVDLIATVFVVAPGTGTPTGSVQFFVDGELYGDAVNVDGSGVATLSTSNLSTTEHTITAIYSGDEDFEGSTDFLGAFDQVVADNADVGLASSQSNSVFGQSVTITATVTASAPGSGTPTGWVYFFDGATLLDQVNLENGVASLDMAGLDVGIHSLTAVYSGDIDFNDGAVSVAMTQTVEQAQVLASITSSADESVFGQSVTLTATVNPIAPGAGLPTGTVTFRADGDVIGEPVTLVDGVATFSVSSLNVGGHTLTADYSGDSSFAATSAEGVEQSVYPSGTNISVTSSSDTAQFGDSVTFTATLSAAAPGAGMPTGTVQFFDGDTNLGTVTVENGIATLSTSSLSVGLHGISVSYSGDASFSDAWSEGTEQSIARANPAMSIESSGTSTYGENVTFYATVTSTAGTPTGSVSFFSNDTLLGTATVDEEGGASLSINWLGAGEYNIYATYSGDGNFMEAEASSIGQIVDKAETGVSVTSSGASTYGDSVTFTASVDSEAGVPTGSVNFYDGDTLLGSGQVNEEGIATLTTSSLNAGNHGIWVSYTGDSNFEASSDEGITQIVSKATSAVALTASAATANQGSSVTFTATVTSVGTPGGTVTFSDGNTVLATVNVANGVASYSTSALAVGAHSITATYNGAANYNTATSSAAGVTVLDVTAPTATLTAKDITASNGTRMTFTIKFTDQSGMNGPTVNNNSTLVTITGPKGFSVKATFMSIVVGQDGSRTVTYSFVPPGGSWDAADAGTYVIKIAGGVVKDTVGNTMAATTAGSFYMSPTPFFDERFYLAHNSDVAAAITAGYFTSGYQHFLNYGQTSGRDPSAFFNEKTYLSLNPDVAAAVRAHYFKSGFDHLIKNGLKEKRKVNAFFDETFYLAQNTDVAAAVRAGLYKSGLDHYLQAGQFEGRSPSVAFIDSYYRAQNPSVVTLVANGTYSSVFQHFLQVGQQAGLAANTFFNESFYLTNYPDIASQVQAGIYKSGLEQYMLVGMSQGKLPNAAAKPRHA